MTKSHRPKRFIRKRHTKLLRLLEIREALLRLRYPVPLSTWAQVFKVSKRTIRRMLSTLIESGMPIRLTLAERESTGLREAYVGMEGKFGLKASPDVRKSVLVRLRREALVPTTEEE